MKTIELPTSVKQTITDFLETLGEPTEEKEKDFKKKRGRGYTKAPHNEKKDKIRRKMARASRKKNRRK